MRKSDLPPIPSALADVALIDDTQCAAAAGMSVSQFRELVQRKVAPQPAVQGARFTRWRLSDIRQFLIDFVETAGRDGAEVSTAKAAKALAGARAKRAATSPHAAA